MPYAVDCKVITSAAFGKCQKVNAAEREGQLGCVLKLTGKMSKKSICLQTTPEMNSKQDFFNWKT